MINGTQVLNIDRNFFMKVERVKEMVNVIFKSFIQFAARLGVFDKRISNYQQQKGYMWLEGTAQIQVKSDFYSYIKQNQKSMKSELNNLNLEYMTCKKEFNSLIDEIECKKVNVVSQNFQKSVTVGGVIKFPKLEKMPNVEVLNSLTDIFSDSEKIVKKIEQRHEHILHKTEDVISQMRRQF